jgi:hypothetical protein
MNPIPIALRRAAPVLLALALAACASGGGTPGATPEELVKKRSAERWQFLIDRKPEQAWDYLSAGVRSTQSREAYAQEMKLRPVHWLTVEPLDAECVKARCDLRTRLEYEITIPGTGSGPTRAPAYVYERWIEVDGAWYFVPKEFQ